VGFSEGCAVGTGVGFSEGCAVGTGVGFAEVGSVVGSEALYLQTGLLEGLGSLWEFVLYMTDPCQPEFCSLIQ